MFERFTDGARQVVVQAQSQARQLGHGFIGCEHLLLALVSLDEAGRRRSAGPWFDHRTDPGGSYPPGGTRPGRQPAGWP